tara:strand:+ start:554 stop:748 length:195 start_codon:yes stop_codon:yes gene_type:complete
VNLLKIGIIHIGAITWMISEIMIINIQAYIHANAPEYPKKNNIPAIKGVPIAIERMRLFIVSVI